MPAYIIATLTVHDAAGFEEYVPAVPPTIEKYGGRYLARGGRSEALEGEWPHARTVVLEFPSYERAKAWHDSQEYSGPKQIRQRTAHTNLVVVEGV